MDNQFSKTEPRDRNKDIDHVLTSLASAIVKLCQRENPVTPEDCHSAAVHIRVALTKLEKLSKGSPVQLGSLLDIET